VIAAALIAAITRRAPAWFCLALATLPPLVIALASLDKPLLLPRYLVFTLFAWTLLAGAALSGLRRIAADVLVVGGLLLIALPGQVAARATTRYNQPDYPLMARVLRQRVRPGDAIIMPAASGIRVRIGLQVYLPARFWPHDVLATRSPAAAAELDSPECDPAACLGAPPRLWVACVRACTDPLTPYPAEFAAIVRARGYVEDRGWQVPGGAIALYTPATSRS